MYTTSTSGSAFFYFFAYNNLLVIQWTGYTCRILDVSSCLATVSNKWGKNIADNNFIFYSIVWTRISYSSNNRLKYCIYFHAKPILQLGLRFRILSLLVSPATLRPRPSSPFSSPIRQSNRVISMYSMWSTKSQKDFLHIKHFSIS